MLIRGYTAILSAEAGVCKFPVSHTSKYSKKWFRNCLNPSLLYSDCSMSGHTQILITLTKCFFEVKSYMKIALIIFLELYQWWTFKTPTFTNVILFQAEIVLYGLIATRLPRFRCSRILIYFYHCRRTLFYCNDKNGYFRPEWRSGGATGIVHCDMTLGGFHQIVIAKQSQICKIASFAIYGNLLSREMTRVVFRQPIKDSSNVLS